jgi:Peptidase family M28
MMHKKLLLFVAGWLLCHAIVVAQDIDKIINPAEVERIEKVLAADDMRGRKTFSPEIDKAADFIAAEFAKNKLQFLNGSQSYFQEFSMAKAKPVSLSGMLDADTLSAANCIAVTTAQTLHVHDLVGYTQVVVAKDADFFKVIGPLVEQEKNLLVLVDKVHSDKFKRLKGLQGRAKFASPYAQLFVLTNNATPSRIDLHATNEVTEQKLKNVVAVLPGRSKKDEMVVFSSHYDHLGVGKPNKEQDSIYNGANDDAAGTTAVIMLSKYFSQLKEKNERTLIFVAFTAEEIGGFGSQYFSKQLNPDKVAAMFNIEMIGTESKWGTNSAFITGFDKSDMGKILQANLAGTGFTFEADPYPDQNLFYRSDNATLAELGVPAHTISTSKMDSEKFYHTQEDEIETLDMQNMAAIIRAIALSSKTIISGKDTPTRVAKEQH